MIVDELLEAQHERQVKGLPPPQVIVLRPREFDALIEELDDLQIAISTWDRDSAYTVPGDILLAGQCYQRGK